MRITAGEIQHDKEEENWAFFSYLYDHMPCMLPLYVVTAKRLPDRSLHYVSIQFVKTPADMQREWM